jgi:serine/threonine protein kinase
MAPEVLREFESYSFPADIWSLGALISFMCNRQHLFMSESAIMDFDIQVWLISENKTRKHILYTNHIIMLAKS